MSDALPSEPERDIMSRWVTEHGTALLGYIRGVVRNITLADDLLQETYRKAWEARHSYVETGQSRNYLLRIADRICVDYFRRQREQNLTPEQWISIEPCTGNADSHALEQQEHSQQLQQALDSLNTVQRRVLLLRFYGDMDFATIATQLDLPLNTVLSHCHRGLQQLRKLFET